MAAADPPLRYPIAEFSLALSHPTVQQIQPPEARPLGTAMSHDFPPRFCHLLVADAGVKARRWPDAKAFREAPVLQSI